MANIVFQTLTIDGAVKRATSETLSPDFSSLSIGADKLPLAQGSTGASAYFDFGSRSLRTSFLASHPFDLVNKQHLEAVQAGLSVRPAVDLATSAALPAYNITGSGSTKTLTGSANGALVIDGVPVSAGMRVLVKDEAASSVHHGIYDVNASGSSTTPYILTRSADMDGSPSSEVRGGVFVFVDRGTVNADSGWVIVTNGTITIDSTAFAWTQFSGAGQVIAGNALQKNVNVFNVLYDDTSVGLNGSNQLSVKDGGVSTQKLADSSVTSTKIADSSVTNTKLQDGAVTTQKIVNSSVTDIKLADNAVTSTKISDNAVTSSKIMDASVTAAKLQNDSVSTLKILDGSVTAGKLAPDAVISTKIADLNVTTSKLADNSVTSTKLANLSVDTGKIIDGAVTTAKISDSGVTSSKIANNAVTAAKIDTSAIGSGLTGGNGTSISVVTGDGVRISGNAVMADYAVMMGNDNASSLTSGKFVYIKPNGNVDLAAKSVVADSVELGVVEASSIASGAQGRIIVRRGALITGFSGLVPGSKYYVSTNGSIALFASVGFVAGDHVHCVGKALNSTTLIFNPRYEFEF